MPSEAVSTKIRFDLAFENASIGMAIQGLDGRYLRVNKALCNLLGYSEAELLSKSWQDVTHPEDVARGLHWLDTAVRRGAGTFETEKRYVHSNGSVLWTLLTVSVVADEKGRPSFLFAQVYDITDRMRVQELGQRLADIVESSDDAIFGVAADGNILTWNSGAETLYGYSAAEIIGRCHTDLVPSERREDQEKLTSSVMDGSRSMVAETVHLRKDGKRVPVSVTASPIKGIGGDTTGASLIVRDISRLSVKDPLTGLGNRALFLDRIEHALATSRRHGGDAAVLFIDLDDFKNVNDSLGHAAGDELLRAVAHRLRSCLRGEDAAARLGGDEFVVLVANQPDLNTAEVVAERILSTLQEPLSIEGNSVAVNASIGIARIDGDVDSLGVLRNADLAMYKAKQAGKGRYQLFHKNMHVAALARSNLRSDLNKAIERREFVLQYQPICDMENGALVGVEAFVRWAHPERGLTLASEFIPIARESGWLEFIDSLVLHTACRQTQLWRSQHHSAGDMFVCVNVSAALLLSRDTVEGILATLEENGLPADALVLEVDERTLADQFTDLQPVISRLHARGVRFSIDDFGTGQSALCHLQRLPVDFLKIDGEVVTNLEEDAGATVLPRAIIGLTSTFDIVPVAEGVEHSGQARVLRALGCGLAQGYLFGGPMSVAEMESVLGSAKVREEPMRKQGSGTHGGASIHTMCP